MVVKLETRAVMGVNPMTPNGFGEADPPAASLDALARTGS
jgi:hypothetical protein